jgi:hypothetical protein
MKTVEETLAPLGRTDKIKLSWSLGLALFWVVFLWGFIERGVVALGLNAFAYLGATAALFLWTMKNQGISLKKNAGWIVPVLLIVASYAIYDNPFLKAVSIPVLPASFAFFYNEAFLSVHGRLRWNSDVLFALMQRVLSPFGHVRGAIDLIERMFARAWKNPGIAKRVAAGIGIFVFMAAAVVIPLLSSADTQFATTMGFVTRWISQLFTASFFGKALVFFLMLVGTVALLLAWTKPSTSVLEEKEPARVDSIIAGIVLGGVLSLYAVFLWIQLGHLWVGKLPVDFSATERLVKDGFWQLLTLTIINTLFAFTTYRKTIPAVQRLLAAFVVASFLLLASAGYRMVLYVTSYGLSYEKFFASYTVAFCAILLLWLVSRFFTHARADVVRFPAMLFLWMYAVLAVMPVEQIILRSNVALSQREGSQIRLFELTMLSPDVLSLVRTYQQEGLLEEEGGYFEREVVHEESKAGPPRARFDWNPWIADRSKIVTEKAWYELNLTNLLTSWRESRASEPGAASGQ